MLFIHHKCNASMTSVTAQDSTMGFEVSDDELIKMSTSELRLLLTKRQVTAEEHRQLRSRRRRLQNRKYARRCAHKKLTEVENLTSEVEEETTELQVSGFC
ncbi:Basic leucine zipper (BZIP) transcription [Fasciola hepatica]|uniref:Basic leucine zipper (BZIP) transcription n=1 Tax=Fasciola hepatica TaxID=6192 RepID=A0A4E0RCP8_FASHE|nr:Basic leucine zipper (BZIP) transcription [Fasciola hepatica]